MTVTFEQMRSRLLTLDQVYAEFAATEPLTAQVFASPSARVHYGDGWADVESGAVTDSWMRIAGGADVQLTKQAALELGSFCRMPRQLQQDIPAALLTSYVNWWLADGLRGKNLQILIREGGGRAGVAFARASTRPCSNLTVLQVMVDGILAAYGPGEILADYKFSHDYEMTHLRLVVPAASRLMQGTGVADDEWCVGVQWKNSLVGIQQSRLDGYLFRWSCTNGATATAASVRPLDRRSTPDLDDAYGWAKQTVEDILGGLEPYLDGVQRLTGVPITGNIAGVLRDLFTQYSVPAKARERVLAELAEVDGELTMYDLMQAITVGANAESVSSRVVEKLLALGGHVVDAGGDRCSACRRLLPGDWKAPTWSS